MNCPRCNTAETTRVARSMTFGQKVVRARRCESCAVEWPTEEKATGDPYPYAPAHTGNQGAAPVSTGTGRPSSSESGLSLFSESGTGDLEASERNRQDHGPATRALVVRKPNLLFAVLEKFTAAWEAQHGAPYRPTPKDRSQLGRYLNPGAGQEGPSPAEIEALPVVFAAYVADQDEFLAKQGWSLAYLLTHAVNKYRAQSAVGARSGYTPKDVKEAEGIAEFARRKQQEEEQRARR